MNVRMIVILVCAVCVVIVGIVVWLRRHRTMEKVVATALHRSLGTIIDVIKRPVTIAVLEQVAEVLRCGRYAHNVSSALEENHAEINALITDLVKADPQIGKLRYLPFHDDIIHAVSNVGFRVLLQALADPRIDELISDVLRENVHQMRDAVRSGMYVPEAPPNHPNTR